jgi:hypothetical protein
MKNNCSLNQFITESVNFIFWNIFLYNNFKLIMKQTNKLVILALVSNISAKRLLRDNIYLQFMDDTLFDDDVANPTIGGPVND